MARRQPCRGLVDEIDTPIDLATNPADLEDLVLLVP
jgi:hypothetical protein